MRMLSHFPNNIKKLMNKLPEITLYLPAPSLVENELIRDVLDSLDLEHAVTWLLEALEHACEQHQNDLHAFHLNLYTLYVDFHEENMRISSVLGVHGEDMIIDLGDFMGLLRSVSPHEHSPHHYLKDSHYQLIHRFDNRHYKRRPYGHASHRRMVRV